MEIEITTDMVAAAGGVGKFKRFGFTEDSRHYHSEWKLDLVSIKEEDIKYLETLLESIPHVRKVKSRLYDISIYLKSKSADTSSKVYKLIHVRGLLINYLKDLPHHWIFHKDAADPDAKVAYYINNIEYHPKVERSGYSEYKPAYVEVELLYRKHGDTKRMDWNLKDDDVYGKTIPQILADSGFFIEEKEHIERYDKEIQRYNEVFPLIGKQFTVHGLAEEFGGSSWGRLSVFTFADDKRKNRVVVDALKDDEDDEDRTRNGYGSGDVSGYFWTNYGDRDDNDYDEGIEKVTKARGKVPIHPHVIIFDLFRHLRMTTHINNMKEYVYDKKLHEKLVLPEDLKSLITLLVEHKDSNFKDLVAGKGGGAIVLLTGPPGVGKTLTAEIFAEAEEKPLYSIQASQLGTNPERLEKNLMKALQRAKRWNAIMLLDESDVYVHERGDDLEQNAIVGVFLRVLEYHASILFLTTNRPDLVDDAIASRCVARIDYQYPSKEDQKKIWKVLSESSEIKIAAKEIDEFIAKHPKVSGRDIKNLIKLAVLISKSKNKEIDAEMLEYVLRFKPTVSEAE